MEYEFCASKVHSTKKHVTFNTTIAILYEPPELQQFLREARTSDYLLRRLTKYRYEQLLTPIFDDIHRLIIQFRLLNLSS
jgi:hypothetical protein